MSLVNLMDDTRRTKVEILEENRQLRKQLETLRHRSHDTLNRINNLIKNVFDGMEQAVFIVEVGEGGEIHFGSVNKAFEKMMGESLGEIKGRLLEDILAQCYSPEIIAETRTHYLHCIDTGNPIDYEENKPVDGSAEWWWTRLTPIRDSQGRVCRMVGTSTRVTTLKNAEEVLRVSESEIRLLNNVITAASSSPNQEAVLQALCRELALFFKVPQAAAGLLDEKREKVTIVVEYLEPGRVSSLGNEINLSPDNELGLRVIRDGKAVVVNDVLSDPNIILTRNLMEQRGTHSIMILPLFAGEEVVGTIGVDAVTPRPFSTQELEIAQNAVKAVSRLLENVRLTRSLQENEERYMLSVEAGKIGVWDYDIKTGKFFLPSIIKKLLGYSNQEIQDTTEGWTPLIIPDDLRRLVSIFEAGITGLFPGQDIEYRMRHRDGSIRSFSARGKVVKDKSGSPLRMFGTISDVTEQKNIEGELEKAVLKLGVSFKQLEQRNREVTLLNEMSSLLQSCTSSSEAYAVTADLIPRLFPQHAGMLYVFSQARDYLVSVASWREPAGKAMYLPQECWALRRGKMHILTRQHSRLGCQHIEKQTNGFEPYICAPLNAQGEVIGSLLLQGEPDRDMEAWTKLVGTVADQLALTLTNIHLSETIRDHAIRDPLTGLYNRQYMNETLEREFRRAVRRKDSVGVIMFDIDFFKQYNDTYGHLVGDSLLETLGEYLKLKTRGEDVVCRYGGDEFIIIMPGADETGTLARAEQLREGTKKLPASFDGKSLARINLSMGIAIFPVHGDTPEDILRAADIALLEAKNQGRDRVVVSQINTFPGSKGDINASS